MFLARLNRVREDRKNKRIYIEVDTPVLSELPDYSVTTMEREVLQRALAECPPTERPENFTRPHHYWDFDEYEIVIRVKPPETYQKERQEVVDKVLAGNKSIPPHPDGALPYA